MDEYVEFVKGVRHICLHDFGTGPAIEDLFTFLSPFAELARGKNTFYVFKLCCLCFGHVLSRMFEVELKSGRIGTTNMDLSLIVESFQRYLLFVVSGGKFFRDLASFYTFLAFQESFWNKTLQIDIQSLELREFYWLRKDVKWIGKVVFALEIASDAKSSFSLWKLVFVPVRLPEQRRRLAQRPRVDVEKTQQAYLLLPRLIGYAQILSLLELSLHRVSFA